MDPTINHIELFEFDYPLEGAGTGVNRFNLVYELGSTVESTKLAVKLHTDDGVTDEYVLVTSTSVSPSERLNGRV